MRRARKKFDDLPCNFIEIVKGIADVNVHAHIAMFRIGMNRYMRLGKYIDSGLALGFEPVRGCLYHIKGSIDELVHFFLEDLFGEYTIPNINNKVST
jgi:hypothetical protein